MLHRTLGRRGVRYSPDVHGVWVGRILRLQTLEWPDSRLSNQRRTGRDGDLKPNLGSSAIAAVAYAVLTSCNWHVHSLVSLSHFFFTPNDTPGLAAAISLSVYLSG